MSFLARLFFLLACLSAATPALVNAAVPGPECPVLDVTDALARKSIMNYVCFHQTSQGDPAHNAVHPGDMLATGDKQPFNSRAVDYRYFLLPLTLDGGARGSITLSAGIASLLPVEDQQALFERADSALYNAKARGRNQTVVAGT